MSIANTKLSRLLAERVDAMGITVYELAARAKFSQAMLWRTIHEGKPLPAARMEAVGRALGWEKGSPEYGTFADACEQAHALAQRVKKGSAYTQKLETRLAAAEAALRKAEDDNRTLKDHLALRERTIASLEAALRKLSQV